MIEKPKVLPSLINKEPVLNLNINKPVIKEVSSNTDVKQKLFDFIIGGEGSFQAKAFCDSYYKIDGKLIRKPVNSCERFSIGYGTISFPGEVINKDEAVKRMELYLSDKYKMVDKGCFSEKEKIAILDYQYQFGQFSQNINNYIARCDHNSIKQILYPYGKGYAWGIQKRRIRGYDYFNS